MAGFIKPSIAFVSFPFAFLGVCRHSFIASLPHAPLSLSRSRSRSLSLTMVLASDEQQPLAGTAQQAPGSFYQQQPNAVPYQGATAPPPSTTAHQPQPQYNIPSPYTQAASSNAPTYMQPGAAPYYTQSAAVVSPYGGQTVYTQVQQPYQQNPAGTVYIVHNDPRTEGHVAAAATTLILGFCCCWVWLFGLMYDIPHSHSLSLSLSLSLSVSDGRGFDLLWCFRFTRSPRPAARCMGFMSIFLFTLVTVMLSVLIFAPSYYY
jgi:hypothetical protein